MYVKKDYQTIIMAILIIATIEKLSWTNLISFFTKGVVETCSHPVVTDTDDLTTFETEKVISTKSYFAFWDALLSRKPIYDSFVGAIVQVLEKLDLSTEVVR